MNLFIHLKVNKTELDIKYSPTWDRSKIILELDNEVKAINNIGDKLVMSIPLTNE